LSIDASGAPTEKFGVGGEITWTAGAGSGTSSPVAPSGVSVPAPVATSAVVTVTTGVVSGATVNAYIAAGAGAFSTATKNASSATDADSTSAGFQIQVNGLTANTAYTVYVTQTVGGAESLPSTGVSFTTAPLDSTLTLSSANVFDTNDGIDGSNPSNLVLTFNEAVTGVDCTMVSVSATAQPNIAGTGSVGPVNTTTITCPLSGQIHDATTDVSYTVTIAAGSVTTASGVNATLTGTFMY
jgi:hypothetical protein